MGRTDWLAPLRNGFSTDSRRRSRRRGPWSVEALERRIPLSDPLGLLTGPALLGGGLAAAEAEAAPPADDAAPVPEEDRRTAGVSPPSPEDDPAFPPPETLEANTAAATPPPPSSPADPPAASALTADLLDDLLAPPPAAAAPPAAPAAADLDRDPLVDTSPKTGGGGAGGHDAAGGSGGGGEDGARSRGGLIADEPADGTTGDGTADFSGGDAVAFSTTGSGGGYGSGSGGGSGSGSGGGDPPVAVPDLFEVNYTRLVVGGDGNVVGNDHNYNQYGAQIVLVTPPEDHDVAEGGQFVLDATGGFNYLAPRDWDLTDEFTYKITSPNGDSSAVTVTLIHQNSPPGGSPETYGAMADAPLEVGAAEGVLANDTDIDKDFNGGGAFYLSPALGLVAIEESGPAHGALDLRPDGSFTYTPNDPDWHGTDSFQYRVWDTKNGQLAMADPRTDPTTVTILVNDLHVFHAGPSPLYQPNDVTEHRGQTVVGAGVGLSVGWVGPGFGPQPVPVLANHQWLPAGRAVKDYDESTGTLLELEEQDLAQPGLHLYWVDGGAKTASVRVTADGQPLTAEGNFDVAAPTGMNFTSEYGEFHYPETEVDAWLQLGYPVWHSGAAGITYRYTVTAPANYGGEFGTIQTVSSVRRRTFFNGTVEKFRTEDTFVLDEILREGQAAGEGDSFNPSGILLLSAGETDTSEDIEDSPRITGDAELHKRLDMNDNFAVFLMYRPLVDGDDAIYVPIWKFRWGLEARLFNDGTQESADWRLDPTSHTDPTSQGPTTQFPEWTTTVLSLYQNPGFQPEPQP